MRVLILVGATVAALLDDAIATDHFDRPLDFSLYATQRKSEWNYGATIPHTTTKWLGVTWRERYGERFHLGIFGGYAFLTQTGNAVTAGQELDGYHVGISADVTLFRRGPIDAFITTAYTYQNVKHDGGQQDVKITWHEPSAALGAGIRLHPQVRLYGGANYGYVEGEQRVSGTTNQTTDFERKPKTGGFAGLEVLLDPGGYIGIGVQSGANRGAGIYFGRQY